MHTFAAVKAGPAGAVLTGRRERLRVAYAATVPAVCHTAVDAPTTPGPGANMLR